ncbi:SUMF1/EgtB/PvdO family nonheme iron enzyme [Piscinibacter sp. HJYY11]|nr:SUMF1/EgtB/PvdO family nonheme iron enzyme [Piscinibacter sp. HJYY11]
MRRAGRELLSLALMDTRNHSLRWMSAIEAALPGFTVSENLREGLNPPLWSLGHLAWYQEHWISRNVQRQRGTQADPTALRLASIEPLADQLFHPSVTPAELRWDLELPEPQAIRQYLADTLETTLELLDHAPDEDDALYFFRLALFHEDAQLEAFAELSQTLGFDASLLPPIGTLASRAPVLFPATRWMLGSPPGGFAFDNERPAHEHGVPEFEIDAQPVTWGQYCEFVEDGGYDDERHWSPEGWAWVQREGRRTPRHVDQMRQSVLMQRFGKMTRVPMTQPAMHVSWYEADAWCRWAQRRLPTELEWEVAAHQGASRGVRFGQVWEWTAGSFRPYPGFAPGPDAQYSQAAFGSHKVLRGGSFATNERMRNAKYRRFLLPQRDDVFSGFRSVAM